MKQVLRINNSITILLIIVAISGCSTNSFFILRGEKEMDVSYECKTYHSSKFRTKRLLKKLDIPSTADSSGFSYEVAFKGSNNNFIGVVNCYGGFQDPRYLIFQNEKKIKIFSNVYNLEEIYKEFKSFMKINEVEGSTESEIWEYIVNFVETELINKYNKLPNW